PEVMALARSRHAPVLLVVGPHAESETKAAADAAAERALTVVCDSDEWPEVADFARLSATVWEAPPSWPIVAALDADAAPRGVVSGAAGDEGWPGRIDDLVSRAVSVFPAVRLAEDPVLQKLR